MTPNEPPPSRWRQRAAVLFCAVVIAAIWGAAQSDWAFGNRVMRAGGYLNADSTAPDWIRDTFGEGVAVMFDTPRELYLRKEIPDGLLERAAEEGREVLGLKELTALAAEGDPVAVTLIRESGRRLGEILAGAVNLLNPAVIVLGGDLAEAYDHLVAGVREVVFQQCTALATRQLRVVPSALWDEAGVRGCAAMVAEEILSPEAVNASLSG